MIATDTPGAALSRQLRGWRERRKLSAQTLADRIKEDGGTLSRVAISKIENGDRGVSLDEWLQLAYALAVPPPLLFLDLAAGIPVRVVPGAEMHPWLAWQWLVGEEAPVTSDHKVKRVGEWHDALATVRVYRREVGAADRVRRAEQALEAAEYAENPERVRKAREQEVDALRELAEVLDEMVELEMTPPGQPPARLNRMRALKLLRYPREITMFDSHEES